MSYLGLRVGMGVFLLALCALIGAGADGGAAEIPRELQVPQEWIEGAKREGKVIIYGSETPQEANAIHRGFSRR